MGWIGWECEQLWYRNEVAIARYSSIKEEKTRESLM